MATNYEEDYEEIKIKLETAIINKETAIAELGIAKQKLMTNN